MDNAFVTLGQAKRLYALSYPQDQWPQMLWLQSPPGHWVLRHRDGSWAVGHYEQPITAPTYLRALEWLEREKGYCWLRATNGKWAASCPKTETVEERSWLLGDTPAGLLDAILDRVINNHLPSTAIELERSQLEAALRNALRLGNELATLLRLPYDCSASEELRELWDIVEPGWRGTGHQPENLAAKQEEAASG